MKFSRRLTKRYLPIEKAELVRSGEHYFTLLESLIASAKKTVIFHVYIFDPDAIGRRILDALKQASQRGVSISLMVDAFGSQKLTAWEQELKTTGIAYRVFAPLLSADSSYVGRRLHQKIVIADNEIALVGGINVSDRYRGTVTETAWLDYAVLIKGKPVAVLERICEVYWRKKMRLHLPLDIRKELRVKKAVSDKTARVSWNDWVRRRSEVSVSYRHGIKGAERSIIVVGSYFLPGFRVRRLLKKAASRGVEIKIIVSGVSDIPLMKNAGRYLFGFLLRNRIKVYEWNKSVLHGKALLVDNSWVSIGSYNLNYLSDYRSIEVNLDIADEAFATNFVRHLDEEILPQCVEVKPDQYHSSQNFFTRILQWWSYKLLKFSLLLFLIRTKNTEYEV